MREDTRTFVKELIDFHEANGRQNWTTIRHFEKVKKKCSANYVRKWLRFYKKEGRALLERKIRRKNQLMPQGVETAKRVLEVLKEDSSVSSGDGAAKLNISRRTFLRHRNRFMTPGLVTEEMKIQLGIVPGKRPEQGNPKVSTKVLPIFEETIKVEKCELEREEFDHVEDLGLGHQTLNDDWRESEIEERKKQKPTRHCHCLLCYIRLDEKRTGGNVKSIPIRSSSRNQKDNPSVPIVTSSFENDCGDGQLGENLNVIFALKNIFGLTSSDLVKVMTATNGRDPKEWYNLCESCDIILKEAIAIQQQVLQLSKELEKCKKKVKEKIMKSSALASKSKNLYDDLLLVTHLIRENISGEKRKKAESFPSVDGIVKTEPLEVDEATNDHRGDIDFSDDSDFQSDADAPPIANDDDSVSGANPPETVDILDLIRSQPVKLTVCETCGEEMTPSKLPLHALREHDIIMDGFTVFKCHKEGCKYCSLSKSAYKNHVIKVHTPYEKRKHVCQTCGKKFPVKGKLKEHEKIHTNALTKPYQCEICGSSFAVYSTLYSHRRCVHERNPKYTTRKKRDPATATLPKAKISRMKVKNDTISNPTTMTSALKRAAALDSDNNTLAISHSTPGPEGGNEGPMLSYANNFTLNMI